MTIEDFLDVVMSTHPLLPLAIVASAYLLTDALFAIFDDLVADAKELVQAMRHIYRWCVHVWRVRVVITEQTGSGEIQQTLFRNGDAKIVHHGNDGLTRTTNTTWSWVDGPQGKRYHINET